MDAQKRTRRVYAPEERAAALVKVAANGGNYRKTASETGIPEANLRQWAKGDRAPEAAAQSALKMRPTADDCDRIAAAILRDLESTIGLTNPNQKAVIFGIMVDKAILLRQAAPPEEPAQPIDLSRLTPEQLETLNGWLEGSAVPERVVGDLPASAGSE